MIKNRIAMLRKDAYLTLRELESYVGITNANLSQLENEKRTFRQRHIENLSAFFNVSIDFLIGNSDIGVIVYDKQGKEYLLSMLQYRDLIGKIEQTVVKISDRPINFVFNKRKPDNNFFISDYVVYREFKDRLNEYDLLPVLTDKLNNYVRQLSSKEVEKVISFIEDYILDK